MKIAIVLGTRPEIIKMSPIVRELESRKVDFFIIHTNQHYSANMDKIFFRDLSLPQPKNNLNIQESLHGKMTGRMLAGIEEVLLLEGPDWVLVEGDTNTVLAGALAATKIGIKVGHIEAGLRSYDRSMPEEINRVVTDHLSDALFCPTEKQRLIIMEEGISKADVMVTGNTIVDAVYQSLNIANKSSLSTEQSRDDYMLLTLHRPSNVDDKKTLGHLVTALEHLVDNVGFPILFPVHPRTLSNMRQFGIKVNGKRIKLVKPVSYLEMLLLEKNAKLILTDSGGVQEEACILQVPCVTIRENTERPETLEVGANLLVGNQSEVIISGAKKMIKAGRNWENPFGNGQAGKKIVDFLIRK